MDRPLPSANRGEPGAARNAFRESSNIGTIAFNKVFPTLGKFINKLGSTKTEQDRLDTESRITNSAVHAELQLGSEKLSAIYDNQIELNRLLEQLLVVYNRGQTGSAPAEGGGFPDLDIDLDRRRRPQSNRQRPTRSSKWSRFVRFVRRRANRLYARIATKLVASAFLASVPIAGWLVAAAMFGSDSYMLYQLWVEFSNLSEEEQENAGEGEPLAEDDTTAARQQEAARENLGDVSQMGETQNLTAAEQPVIQQQEAQSQRRRDQAGVTENLEDPVRQEIMQRLARAKELASRPGRNGDAARTSIPRIEAELQRHNARNPVSAGDASRIRAPEPVAPTSAAAVETPTSAPVADAAPVSTEQATPAPQAAPPTPSTVAPVDAPAAPIGEEESTPADEVEVTVTAPKPVTAEKVSTERIVKPTQTAARPVVTEPVSEQSAESSPIRIEGSSLVYDFDQVVYEAEIIEFDGDQPAPVARAPLVGATSNIDVGAPGSGAGTMPAAAGTTAMRVGADSLANLALIAGSGAGTMPAAAGTTAMRVGGDSLSGMNLTPGSGAGTMSAASGTTAMRVGGDSLTSTTPQRSAAAGSTGTPGQGAAPGSIARVAEIGAGFNVVELADGTKERRTGARNWRNNNPGNIEFGDFARRYGAIAGDPRFAIFPTYEDGRKAKEALLFEGRGYAGMSIEQAIARYAPPSENNTASYIQTVSAALGVSPSTPLASLNAQQRTTMLASMERVEGFRAGQTVRISGPTNTATAAAPAPAVPAAGAALAEASTARVSADREQASNTQRMAAEFNQQQVAQRTQQPSAPQTHQTPSPSTSGGVTLTTRLLSTFDQLARAS